MEYTYFQNAFFAILRMDQFELNSSPQFLMQTQIQISL